MIVIEKPPLNLVLFLFVATALSIIWGRIILFNTRRKYMTNLTRFFMRFLRAQQKDIQSMILGSYYVLVWLAGTVFFSLLFKINVSAYFALKPEYIVFIFVGILAEVSVSTILMAVVSAFAPNVDWNGQIESIPWIRSISFMSPRFGPLMPFCGAFIEEFFFRGVLFFILLRFYPEIGVFWAIAVVTILFAVQQMLNTVSWPQALAMAIGSISVSIIGCLLILLTGSFLPALLSHQSFVIFYFRQMGFRYQPVSGS